MYYNNSNRKLTDAYIENMHIIKEQEEQTIYEALTKSVLNVVEPLIEKVQRLLDDIEKYEDDIKKDPERFKGYVKNYKKEYSLIDNAKLATHDLIKELKKLQTILEDLELKPDTRLEVIAERKVLSKAKLSIYTAQKTIKKVQSIITDFNIDF